MSAPKGYHQHKSANVSCKTSLNSPGGVYGGKVVQGSILYSGSANRFMQAYLLSKHGAKQVSRLSPHFSGCSYRKGIESPDDMDTGDTYVLYS